MPKTKLKFDATTAIPAALLPFLNMETREVDVWFGVDELAVAGELNPSLEANRNTILAEKTNIKNQYDALIQTKSATDVDVATARAEAVAAKAETERLKTSTPAPEDFAILTEVKKVFPNMSATDLAKQIPQFKTATEKVVKMEKDLHNQQVFSVLGYKNPEVFQVLMQLPDMLKNVDGEIFIESVPELGKTEPIPTAFVNVKNEQGALEKKTWKDYTETINPSWKLHLPSLNTVEVKKEEENKTWFTQGNEKQGEGTSFLDAHINKQNENARNSSNPLLPKADPNKTVVNQN